MKNPWSDLLNIEPQNSKSVDTTEDRILLASDLLASLGCMTLEQAQIVIRSAIKVSLYGDDPLVIGKGLFKRSVEIGGIELAKFCQDTVK